MITKGEQPRKRLEDPLFVPTPDRIARNAAFQKVLNYIYKNIDSSSKLLWAADNSIRGKPRRSQSDKSESNWKAETNACLGYGELTKVTASLICPGSYDQYPRYIPKLKLLYKIETWAWGEASLRCIRVWSESKLYLFGYRVWVWEASVPRSDSGGVSSTWDRSSAGSSGVLYRLLLWVSDVLVGNNEWSAC